ncbi:MAG: site-specific integrase [Gemmatimonadota bacterium]
MARRRASRVYARTRNGLTRFWGDFRDLNGRREPLIAPGERTATTNREVAEALAAERARALRQAAPSSSAVRKDAEAEKAERELLKISHGIREVAELEAYAAHHLYRKAEAGRTVEGWLVQAQGHLERAVEFFGPRRPLHTIQVRDLNDYAALLQRRSNGRGGTLSPGSVRKYLNTLSNLYRRAQAEGAVPLGFNPVAAMLEKPVAVRREARWLEVHDAARLLEAARTQRPATVFRGRGQGGAIGPHPFLYLYALVGTFLLTGGRKAEVLGLEIEDISFARKTVTFRPNRWRRLKTATSARVVPLWPQLEEILRQYFAHRETTDPLRGTLLFPSSRPGAERMLDNVRRGLDQLALRSGLQEGDVRTRIFRHTYCAARLQTLDGGAPVSPFTVSRELGHGGQSLVDRIYGHLGHVRHRAEVVEYSPFRGSQRVPQG